MKLQFAHFNFLILLVTYFSSDKRCRDFITFPSRSCGCKILLRSNKVGRFGKGSKGFNLSILFYISIGILAYYGRTSYT